MHVHKFYLEKIQVPEPKVWPDCPLSKSMDKANSMKSAHYLYQAAVHIPLTFTYIAVSTLHMPEIESNNSLAFTHSLTFHIFTQ